MQPLTETSPLQLSLRFWSFKPVYRGQTAGDSFLKTTIWNLGVNFYAVSPLPNNYCPLDPHNGCSWWAILSLWAIMRLKYGCTSFSFILQDCSYYILLGAFIELKKLWQSTQINQLNFMKSYHPKFARDVPKIFWDNFINTSVLMRKIIETWQRICWEKNLDGWENKTICHQVLPRFGGPNSNFQKVLAYARRGNLQEAGREERREKRGPYCTSLNRITLSSDSSLCVCVCVCLCVPSTRPSFILAVMQYKCFNFQWCL